LHRKKVFCINSNDDKDFILDKIINSNFTRIPVYENNMENIIGIIDIRDILKIKKLGDNNFLIKSLMREPFILPNTSPLVDVLTQFKEKQERMALVVDEYGSFLGIITLKDIVEEVFGDLNHKERNLPDSGKSIKKLEDGSIIVDGDLSIRDLNKKMKWELPDEEVTTIAGLLLFETGSIPKIGSLFAICGFIFEVIEKKKHQITKIKISKLEK
jgi:Mg2+/Co2+ transporter CorB